MADTTGEALVQTMSEQRLVSLWLADQITGENWNTPRLPGERAAHALYAHLLAWDEWAAAVFELDPPLPAKLVAALRDVDAFNARAVARFSGIPRDDLITALQWASARVIAAARGVDGDAWSERRLPDLAPADATPGSRGPRVRGIMTMLLEHEREHAAEVSSAYGVTIDLEDLRRRALAQEGDGLDGEDDDGYGEDGEQD